ncbi:hypothetical protein ANO11243_009330 [Dothideomycetidae sp. 11243]|nr:hypothetical protein ANO11243_009330 [fungal sp. No.11243]
MNAEQGIEYSVRGARSDDDDGRRSGIKRRDGSERRLFGGMRGRVEEIAETGAKAAEGCRESQQNGRHEEDSKQGPGGGGRSRDNEGRGVGVGVGDDADDADDSNRARDSNSSSNSSKRSPRVA